MTSLSQTRQWVDTFFFVLKISLRSLWIKKSFWLGSLIFSLCLLILFPFSLGTQVIKRPDVQIGCLWAIFEFVAVVSLGQVFYAEKEAGALDILLCSTSPRSALILAKTSFLALLCFSLNVPIILFWVILFNVSSPFFAIFFLKILSLNFFFSLASAGLGVLVHGLTVRSIAKEILQPILFFPLQTGVLLAAVSLSLSDTAYNSLSGAWGTSTWWFILILYPVLFITSSCLFSSALFEE